MLFVSTFFFSSCIRFALTYVYTLLVPVYDSPWRCSFDIRVDVHLTLTYMTTLLVQLDASFFCFFLFWFFLFLFHLEIHDYTLSPRCFFFPLDIRDYVLYYLLTSTLLLFSIFLYINVRQLLISTVVVPLYQHSSATLIDVIFIGIRFALTLFFWHTWRRPLLIHLDAFFLVHLDLHDYAAF